MNCEGAKPVGRPSTSVESSKNELRAGCVGGGAYLSHTNQARMNCEHKDMGRGQIGILGNQARMNCECTNGGY